MILDTSFSDTQFASLCFGYLDIYSICVFLSVFVLLIEGKRSRCSNGELSSPRFNITLRRGVVLLLS
jgi:hypothetical protein